MRGTFIGAALGAAAIIAPLTAASADEAELARGKYLVGIAGCNDCHTPGYFLGKPDMAKYLSGSDVGFEIPGLGVFVGPNLTADKQTGIGSWSQAQIIAALQTGVRPDGRVLAPIMPWHAFASLTKEDVTAIAAFLQSLPPVSHAVPGPFGPGDKVTTFVMRLLPPGQTAQEAPKN
ncbi:MAG: c-type cytochrome [Amaricoccus sp.]